MLETMVPTAASRIRELIESLSGPLHVTLEEGPQAEWLHEGHGAIGLARARADTWIETNGSGL